MAQLPFLAVGRVEDSTTLASFCPDTIAQAQQRDTEDVFKKLLTAAGKKLRHGEKTRLQWNDGSVCCLMDNNKVLLYCVVTSDLQYPERLAYGMLVDLMKVVDKKSRDGGVSPEEAKENELTSHIRSDMQSLMEKYEDQNQWHSLMDALNQVSSAQAPAMSGNEGGVHVSKMDASQDMQARQQKGSSLPMLIGGVVLVILIGAGAFFAMGSGDTTSAPAPPPTTDAPAADPGARWSESVLV